MFPCVVTEAKRRCQCRMAPSGMALPHAAGGWFLGGRCRICSLLPAAFPKGRQSCSSPAGLPRLPQPREVHRGLLHIIGLRRSPCP